jgi:hypothetical protein
VVSELGDGRRRVTVDDKIRALATRRRVPDSHLADWMAMEPVSREAFFNLADDLGFRTAQLIRALELIREIAVRRSVAPASIATSDELARIARVAGSRPERARRALDALESMRYPMLHAELDALRRDIWALKLGGNVRVGLPRMLGSDEVTVSISARSGREMARAIERLADSAAALAEIADRVGGGKS